MKRFLFISICLLQCLVVKSQSLYQCQYWFDQDSVQTVMATFNGNTAQMELDAGSLSAGIHELFIQVKDTTGLWCATQSYMFYKAFEPVNPANPENVTYHCWFDEDFEQEQSGSFGTGQFLLDATNIGSGLHTLFVALESDGLTSTQSYMFFKAYEPVNPTNPENVTYHCWFDEDFEHEQTGSFGTGQFLLDATNIESGLHTLFVALESDGLTSTQNYMFFKAYEPVNPANPENVTYHCWFDEDFEHEQTGSFGTGQFLLDASNIESGLHALFVALESDGLTSTQSYMFYKAYEPVNPANPENVTYHCWFDEDFEHEQTGTYGTGVILLNARGLTEGEHIVNIMLESESLTSTQSYSFEKHFVNGRDIITIINPAMVAGTVSGAGRYEQGDTCTLIATPNELFGFVNWTTNGDVVSDTTEYSFVVTEDATYEANFDWTNPASVDYVSDGLIMYLDGICNTRNGHDTTATVWEDLIGNYDLTVSNYSSYTWEDNHFIGLGNGGYLNTGKTWKYFNSLNDDITIEIVTYIDCDKTSPLWRGLAGWHSGSDGTNFQNDQGGGRMQTLGELPVSEADNTISTVSYTRFNGSFLNGIWKTNNSNIPSGINSNQTVVFGNSYGQSRGWNDSIYCIRMYNRSLTPEEIAYNHNIDVERFGASSSNTFGIIASANPTNGGSVTGAGTYELGETCTLTAIANPNYTFMNWTENGAQVSADPVYSFTVSGSRALVANFVQDQPNTYIISASVQPAGAGTVTGSGGYAVGSTCTLHATPAQGYFFLNWTQNGNVVSTNSTYSFTVTGNANYTANFTHGLPELHVTGITHSEFMAGQQVSVSWTVQNDGTAATPNGALWHDRVWLSVESRVAADDNNPILLGTFDNLTALNVGEYYTQTQTFTLPIDIVGEYYLFVLTDAYDCHTIYWDSTGVQLPYNPPPYLGCLSHHCYSCPNVADNRIYEQSEYAHGDAPGGYYNDNFFYEFVDIAVPLVPDLQVTSIIPPTNFFSGTSVNVTATVSNLGEIATLTSSWADALFVSSQPDFSTATCIAVVHHSGVLALGDSYQVAFGGTIPVTMYGEAYFFVYTDCYEQVYEHVLNHNNIMMSEAVNVILSPPADLTPTDLTVPATVSTGESFAYSYTVYNSGAGNPNVNSWVDKVYLSQNTDTLVANAVLLKTVNHYGGLQPGVHYSVSESLVLPSSVASGTYYLYVHADADNAVFEYLYDGNNLVRSNAINIIQPDLQVSEINAPEQITAGFPLNLSYTLTNAGEGAVSNRMVTDRVYISVSGNMADTIRLANIRHNVTLASGQSLAVMCNDLAPYQLTDGTYHLIVLTDWGNEINESNEGNNSLSHYPMSVFHQPLPDLVPVSLTIPEVVQAGETVAVEFDITNNGDLDLLNSNCTFNIYATWSDQEVLCPVQSQTLPLGNTVSIGIGQTVHFARTVLVPPTVTSSCNTFELIANKGGLVPELDTTNNVIAVTVTVLDCPLPDLRVADIVAAEIQSGVENPISFTVNNNGTADFAGGFNTAVYVRSTTDTIPCPLVLQLTPETTDYVIPVGGSLSFTQKVLVPPMANASCTILEVVVDEANIVLESNEENNATTTVTTVLDYPFDLETTALQVQETVWAGETTSLAWTVKNIGTCPSEVVPLYVKANDTYTLVQGETLPQPWMDKVYVSHDAVLSEDDIELCSVARSTVLQPNGTYTVERTLSLPYTHLGAQYLLCVSDATHVTYDSDTLNNVKSIPIEVQLGSLPDLRLTALTVDEEMTCDRAYWVRYTVVNEGERVTQRSNWTDAFFIGEGMTTIGALQLGAKIHNGALEVGESYTDSIEILLPNGLEGDYFLIGYTDRTNQIYEHDNEDDNVLAVPVQVLAPEPCDLVAVQPEFPVTVVSGEEMTVSFQLRNIGQNPAVGRVRNAVYLSTDDEWSSEDKMLGYSNIDINLAANAQQTCSLSGMLTSVPEGNYYVIVKANILNALNESNYENNICVSMLTTAVGYPVLAIGEQVDRTLAADQYIYYKLEVGPEYEGQTLSCTLTTAEQMVANGLYLSHEAVPTLAQYDYGDYAPYAQEIEVLIPALEQGDYYLLAKGSAQSGNPQQVSIATTIINFEILHIDADHGANTGSITTKVTGAKFDSIMDVRLVQGNDYLPAEKVFFSNSTETFTTFDLAEMPLGTYAMEAELPGGIITIKGDAFTIEEGLPAELAINIVAPASVRSGNTFAVNIEYGNIGTTDLNVSGFVVVSRNGHPIGFSTEELLEGQTELTFSTAEGNGNPDVLRPAYLGTKAIMVKATPSTNVSLAVYAIRRQY